MNQKHYNYGTHIHFGQFAKFAHRKIYRYGIHSSVSRCYPVVQFKVKKIYMHCAT